MLTKRTSGINPRTARSIVSRAIPGRQGPPPPLLFDVTSNGLFGEQLRNSFFVNPAPKKKKKGNDKSNRTQSACGADPLTALDAFNSHLCWLYTHIHMSYYSVGQQWRLVIRNNSNIGEGKIQSCDFWLLFAGYRPWARFPGPQRPIHA